MIVKNKNDPSKIIFKGTQHDFVLKFEYKYLYDACFKNIKFTKLQHFFKNISFDGCIFDNCTFNIDTYDSAFINCIIQNSKFNFEDISFCIFNKTLIKNCNFIDVLINENIFKSTKILNTNFIDTLITSNYWHKSRIKNIFDLEGSFDLSYIKYNKKLSSSKINDIINSTFCINKQGHLISSNNIDISNIEDDDYNSVINLIKDNKKFPILQINNKAEEYLKNSNLYNDYTNKVLNNFKINMKRKNIKYVLGKDLKKFLSDERLLMDVIE